MSQYSRSAVKRKGKRDGRAWRWRFWPFDKEEKAVIPEAGQTEPAPFETELNHNGGALLAELAEKWKKQDETLKPAYCQARQRVEHARLRLKKEAVEAEEAAEEFAEAQKKYHELPPTAIKPGWMYFWLIIIGAIEYPINSMIFSILGASKIETYIMAGVICIGIPLIAHSFGKILRQDTRQFVDKILLAVIPFATLAVLFAVAVLRSDLFEVIGSEKILGIHISPEKATVIFIILNVFMFVLATVFSYEGSHPQKRLCDTLKRHLIIAKRNLAREKKEAIQAEDELEAAETLFQRRLHIRDTAHKRLLAEADIIVENTKLCNSIYRDANRSVRKELPLCFKTKPQEITIPEDLVQMDWDCNQHKMPANTDGMKIEANTFMKGQ